MKTSRAQSATSAARTQGKACLQAVADIRAALAPLANADEALSMRAYLRDQFAFLGIHAPVRRKAVAAVIKEPRSAAELLQIADLLWQAPAREFKYTAVDLLARQHACLGLDAIGPLLSLAQREPWWETVDGLAAVIGDVLRGALARQPDAQFLMDQALHHECMWVRRIAMTHQLGWRLQTDATRLFAYATTLAPDPDFFIRKAIGWALRDYARWQPDAVASFVTKQRAKLSPLTVREAAKHLGPV
jgi:3-methyladenine DNA glycosylase AlkD